MKINNRIRFGVGFTVQSDVTFWDNHIVSFSSVYTLLYVTTSASTVRKVIMEDMTCRTTLLL
jgi:hypothetical protein